MGQKTNRITVIMGFLLLIFAGLMIFPYSEKPEIISSSYVVMGGVILEVKLFGKPGKIQETSSAIHRVVSEVDDACNIYNPESELSQLNTTAHEKPFKCSDLLWEVLWESKKYYELSDGAFDISATPLMKLWGFYRKRKTLPSEKELTEVKAVVGLDKVVFNPADKSVRFTIPGIRLDLGGIAKGFAVDKAAEVAEKMGVHTGLINLSGNALCLSKPFPGKEKYVIGVKNPLKKHYVCGTIELLKQSVATSGDYERYVVIEGKHFAHIMDPRTGKPVENVFSVTVITPSATAADALSTSIFINGREFAEKIYKENSATTSLIIRKDDKGETEMIKIGNSWGECSL